MAKKTLSGSGRLASAAPPAPTPATQARTTARTARPARVTGNASRPAAAAVPKTPAPTSRQVARASATSSVLGRMPRQGDTAPIPERRAAVPATPAKPTRHKVQAKKMGFLYHERRRVGDVFLVHGKDFNPSWMTVVDGSTPLRKTTGKQELRRLHDEILSQKRAERLSTDDNPEIPTGTANPLGAEE